MEIDVRQTPQVSEYQKYGEQLIGQANAIKIESIEDFQLAESIREGAKERKKLVKSLLDPFCNEASRIHKHHTGLRSSVIKPFDDVIGIVDSKIVEWRVAEDKRLVEIQKKLDEEAKLEAAVNAEKEGNIELAEAIMSDNVPVTSAPIAKTNMGKTSIVETWDFEIVNEKDLPRSYLMPDEKKIKAIVTAQKSDTNIPGVRVFPKNHIKSKPKGLTSRTW